MVRGENPSFRFLGKFFFIPKNRGKQFWSGCFRNVVLQREKAVENFALEARTHLCLPLSVALEPECCRT